MIEACIIHVYAISFVRHQRDDPTLSYLNFSYVSSLCCAVTARTKEMIQACLIHVYAISLARH